MATASALIANCRLRIGDTTGEYLTTDRALTWLDQAHNSFVEILYPLRRKKSFTVAANQEAFTLPDDLLILEVVTVTQGLRHQLQYRIPTEFERLKTSGKMTGMPEYWTLSEQKLYIWPFFGTASRTTLVNASTLSTDTTITLASTGNLRDYGRAIVGTQEEVEYTGKTATTITGVTRGVGGTTASTHASAITLTQTDMQVEYPRRASALASTSTPDIPSYLHQTLENYVLYLAELSQGNMPKADYYLNIWNMEIEKARYTVTKQQVQRPLRVIDVDHFSRNRYEGWE